MTCLGERKGAGIKIGRNDPALAHGVANRELARFSDSHAAFVDQLAGQDLKRGARLIRKRYGQLALVECIERELGRRARGWFAVLESSGRDGLFLVILDYRREAWDAHERGVIVLQHTVARIFQRTLNHAELRAVGEVLYEHISNALQYCNKQEDPTTFRTVTTEGVVIWKRDEENDLFAKTWISRETAIEPDLIEAMDAVANSGCIVLP